MTPQEAIVYRAIALLQAYATLMGRVPIYALSIRVVAHSKPLKRSETDAVLQSLEAQGLIVHRRGINYELYAIKNYQKEQAMNIFEQTIKTFLDEKAKGDSAFAEKYSNKKKSISDCCKFIISEVKKTRRQGFADDEIYGLAIHYYDEENLDFNPKDADSCKVVVNKEIQLTEEDKRKIKEEARKKLHEEEMRKQLRKLKEEQEKEQRKKEAAEKRAAEKAAAEKKAREDEGLLFHFDD